MNNMKTGFLKVFIVAAAVLIAVQAAESRETVDRVVAVVNDDIITLSEMNEMVTSINLTNNHNMDQDEVLQQMIEQKLFEQEADKLGIKVSEAELDAGIAQVKQRFNLNDEQMAEVLQKQNLTMESFREQWRLQTLSNKLLDSQLKNKIVVTDEEVAVYYKENYGGAGTVTSSASAPSDSPVEEVRIAHILISSSSPDAEARVEKVAEMAKSGQDFSQLAKEYSDDSHSADKGGDLGYFKQGDLIETLETAIENTPEGGVAGPVESPAGYHVIKVVERKSVGGGEKKKAKKGSSATDGLAIDDQTKKEITDILYRQKAEEQLKTWLDGIKSNAYIDVRL
ncbi:MAG: peptidylprolyl isomerase [Candidatus Dadabacteria bacterium]|nr:peptidylprolyl isomerase [Candidatus Dadabacteria bacterium]